MLLTDMPRKVICAVSGGVDSSVAAALLKRQGFDVLGVFMKLWPEEYFGPKAQRAVKRISSKIKIPFLVFDFSKEFKKKVVDYFLREYERSRTPNPCVKCNKEIKFGLFFEKAMSRGVDFVATGHYVRKEGKKLLVARDKKKDQSYFLYNLSQDKLKKILFPLGNYSKSEVKKMAQDFGIADLVRPESKDLCFLKGKYQDFLKKYLKLKPGPIFNTKGKRIGRHQGLSLYTIGQRKEIRIPGPCPYYVLKLDFKNNALIVSDREKELFKKNLIVKRINWISGREPKLPLKTKAKIRYLHPADSATIVSKLSQDRYSIEFRKPQRAITPGQSIVFYHYQELLGGGIIV